MLNFRGMEIASLCLGGYQTSRLIKQPPVYASTFHASKRERKGDRVAGFLSSRDVIGREPTASPSHNHSLSLQSTPPSRWRMSLEGSQIVLQGRPYGGLDIPFTSPRIPFPQSSPLRANPFCTPPDDRAPAHHVKPSLNDAHPPARRGTRQS